MTGCGCWIRSVILITEVGIINEDWDLSQTSILDPSSPPYGDFSVFGWSNVVTEALDKHQRFKLNGPNITYPTEKIKKSFLFVGRRFLIFRYFIVSKSL